VRPPARCAICEDEREAVYWKGQRWTTLADLRCDHHNVIQPLEPNLIGIRTEPHFAIGQQALLIQTLEGNVLWDCVSLLDDATIAEVQAAGGLAAIASSHPHFYGVLVEWSRAVDGIPIYLHAADQSWVVRPDPMMVFWEGATYPLAPGLTLIHCGGILPVQPCSTGPRALRAEVRFAPEIRFTWSKTTATSPLCTVTLITSPCQGQASGGLPSGSFRSAMIASTGALRGGWWQAMPKVQ
jgi:hypothetical protein